MKPSGREAVSLNTIGTSGTGCQLLTREIPSGEIIFPELLDILLVYDMYSSRDISLAGMVIISFTGRMFFSLPVPSFSRVPVSVSRAMERERVSPGLIVIFVVPVIRLSSKSKVIES